MGGRSCTVEKSKQEQKRKLELQISTMIAYSEEMEVTEVTRTGGVANKTGGVYICAPRLARKKRKPKRVT